MRRGGIAALAAFPDDPGTHSRPELEDGDEGVSVISIELPAAILRSGPVRGERAPAPIGERDRNAGRGIAERRAAARRNALEAIDLAPRDLPAAVIAPQRRNGVGQRLQFL